MPGYAFELNWTVTGDVQLRRRFHDLAGVVDDFEAPLKRIGDEVIYPEIRHQFEAEGDPRWEDLKPDYARRKAAAVGDQPILRYTGGLEASMTDKHAPGSVYQLNSELLEIGSELTTPDGKYSLALIHQKPNEAGPLPARPMMLLRPAAQTLMVMIFHQWIASEGRRLGLGLDP